MKNLVKLSILIILSLFIYSATKANSVPVKTSCTVTSVKASHILVDSKEEATLIKSKIDNGASFEAMAKKYSKCPSGQEGGDLGYFGRGQMVESFENEAFSLPAGKVSEPVKTQFGWHLIKVYDKR